MQRRKSRLHGGNERAPTHHDYWKRDHFWLGKLVEYPEIMTQGESFQELEENLKDAYELMVLDEIP